MEGYEQFGDDSIKLHFIQGDTPDWGTESADFRGPKFIGAAEGDHHSVVHIPGGSFDGEIKHATKEQVSQALIAAPEINRLFRQMKLPLRLGVWLAHQ